MRARLKPVFAGFNPNDRSTLASLVERSLVLPAAEAAGAGAEAEAGNIVHPQHIFADAEFQPTGIFLNHLRDEVALEMEGFYDHEDCTMFPSSSENFELQLAAAIAADRCHGGTTDVAEHASLAVEAGGQSSVADAVTPTENTAGLQRKFIPLAPPLSPDEERAAATSATAQRKRMPLVVIASLIDKTPNLAGLCRTCEVFNCEALCLSNMKMTKDPQFQAISVTAEKWLPVREVQRTAVGAYLVEMKAKGYTIVGVEQTHCSIQLDEYKFDPTTVLVLGAEKEGIDAELLPLLDACVEIPQAGQIRSLNVHVSGSLAVWEYTRQRLAAASAGV